MRISPRQIESYLNKHMQVHWAQTLSVFVKDEVCLMDSMSLLHVVFLQL